MSRKKKNEVQSNCIDTAFHTGGVQGLAKEPEEPVPIYEAELVWKKNNERPSPLVELVHVSGNVCESFLRAVAVGLSNKLQDAERDKFGVPVERAHQLAEDSLMMKLRDLMIEDMTIGEPYFRSMLEPEGVSRGIDWYQVGLQGRALQADSWTERCQLLSNENYMPGAPEMEAAARSIARPILVVQNNPRGDLYNARRMREQVSPILIRMKYNCTDISSRFYGVKQTQRDIDMDNIGNPIMRGFLRGFEALPGDTTTVSLVGNVMVTCNMPDPAYIQERRKLKMEIYEADQHYQAEQKRKEKELIAATT